MGAERVPAETGVEVMLPARPTRIAAYDAPAAAFLALGVRPVAIFGAEPLDPKDVLAGPDLIGIEPAGETYGEVNLEKLLALDVDRLSPRKNSVPPYWTTASVAAAMRSACRSRTAPSSAS